MSGVTPEDLADLPCFRGTIVRAMAALPPAADALFRPGRVVRDPALLRPGSDDTLPVPRGWRGPYDLHIVSKTGRCVEDRGDRDGGLPEPEVIFAPGTRFRVLDREDGVRVWGGRPARGGNAGGWETKTVIYLEEI